MLLPTVSSLKDIIYSRESVRPLLHSTPGGYTLALPCVIEPHAIG